MQLVDASVFFGLQLIGLVELLLSEGWSYVFDSDEVDLASIEVVGDRPVYSSQQQLKRLQLDVEQVQAKHRYQVIDEASEVDFMTLVHVLTRHIVVREEVNAKCALKQWKHALVAVEIQG